MFVFCLNATFEAYFLNVSVTHVVLVQFYFILDYLDVSYLFLLVKEKKLLAHILILTMVDSTSNKIDTWILLIYHLFNEFSDDNNDPHHFSSKKIEEYMINFHFRQLDIG